MGSLRPLARVFLIVALVFAWGSVASAQEAPAKEGKPVVVLETTEGNITIELNAEKAPLTVKNFLQYVEDGFFNGTIFHRVIPDFMIQGGGFTKDMRQKGTRASIKNEAENGLKNDRGTIAMARTGVVDSATAQFFINHKDNDALNHKDDSDRNYGYAVFGKVTEGMDVVDKIAGVKTGVRQTAKGPMQNVPESPIVIKKIAMRKPESK